MTREDGVNEIVRHWVEKAGESFAAASDEMHAGRLSFAVNRAYYACFYAISAVLIGRGHHFRKHSGVRAAFHQKLVKTGLLAREAGLLYDELFEARQRGDYLELVSFEKAQVEIWLQRVKEFLEAVAPLVQGERRA